MEQEAGIDLADGKSPVPDLVDLERMRGIFEKFTRATGFTITFLDHPGKSTLIAPSLRDFCHKFHKSCPASEECCRKSSIRLLSGLNSSGQQTVYTCDHGLAYCAMPVMLDGKHIASIAAGQVLLGEPDTQRFKNQAAQYGFDEVKYLEALKEVPVAPEEKLRSLTACLAEQVSLLAEQKYALLASEGKAERLERSISAVAERLKVSERKFLSLAETLPDLVWETDGTDKVVYISPKVKDLLGYETREALGRSLLEFICAGDEAAARRFTSSLLNKKPFRNIESGSTHKDCREKVLESSGNPIFDEAGRFAGYRGISRDITERKRLEEGNELKATLLDSVKDAIYLHDPEGRIVYANEAAYAQLGYTEEEISDMNFRQLLTPASAREFAAQTKYAFEQGKAVFGAEHLRADGGIIPVEAHAHALELEGEKFILRVVRDITERKQAERALKESEEKFRVTFESAPVGMCLADTEGRILTANGAMCSILGYSMGELLHRGFPEFAHADDKASVLKWLPRVVNGEPAPRSLELMFTGRDGRLISAEVSAAGFRHSPAGQPGLIIALQDITERKENDRAQRKLMKELQSTNSEIMQFNSLIAHDLQEPLRMVRSYSQLLEKRLAGKLDGAAQEFLGYVTNGGKLMQKMLEDLMYYLREGANPEELQEVDLDKVMGQVLFLLKSSIEETKASVTCARLPVVIANKSQMMHLMQNLVGNAIKFRRDEPPRVSVTCEAAQGEYIFKVSDNGIGVDPKFSERVFKIFQRLHSREEYPGTGVGLALCKKIVENHGGRIWLESAPGKGTAIYFSVARRSPVPEGRKAGLNAGK
ncbi:MAG: PAS domain S-box protein [Elusimicrobiales bacterium]|nr:PAS domain S-box protein [Elusimicrobiales bacterium]